MQHHKRRLNCFHTVYYIYPGSPLNSFSHLCQTGLTLLFLHFHSWFVAEGCGRYTHHEEKEMGCGTWADGTVLVSVHLSLPQTGRQWTAGENEDLCWFCKKIISIEILPQVSEFCDYNCFFFCCCCFLSHSSFMLTSLLPLHQTRTLEPFLMWVSTKSCFSYLYTAPLCSTS